MRWSWILLATVIAVPAAAADVSRFDGSYSGTLELKPGLDGPACKPFDVKLVHLVKGQMQPGPELPSVSGTINVDGDVDGHVRKADGGDVAFTGRIGMSEYEAKFHLIAAVVDEKTGCGWNLNLFHE